MKQKVCYAGLITMSFLVLFYACQKELPGSDPGKKANPSSVKLTIPEAIKYYNKLKAEQGNLVKTEGTSLSNGKQPNRKYILFEKAYASETRTATFVEVPVLYNQRFAFVINKPQENIQRAREEGKEIFEASFDRLLIYRNKTTGTTDQRIITYIPEIEYLRRHKGDISHNQINKLDEDFEGFIEYKKWDGTRLYLLKIQNGKTLGRINLLKDFTKKTRGATTNSIVCETYTTENWGMSCVSADPEGYIEYCEPYIIGVTTHEFCYDNGLTGDPCIDYGDCGVPLPEPDPSYPADPGESINNGKDPDLRTNCASFAFLPTGPNDNYQTCGVTGIDIDIIHSFLSGGEIHVGYSNLKINQPIYFEFPRKRANGVIISAAEAAQYCAEAADRAEDRLEELLGDKAPLGQTVPLNTYVQTLSAILATQGGRATLQKNYPNSSVRAIQKGLTNGSCQ